MHDEELRDSVSNIISEQFQNPKAILKRFESEIDSSSLMKISRYYVDDFIRTTDSFAINLQSDNQPPYFHKHDFVEIMYVIKGYCKQHLDSVENTVILEEGEAIIINPNTIHAVYPVEKDNRVIKIFMPTDFWEKNMNEGESSGLFQYQEASAVYQYIIFNQLCRTSKRAEPDDLKSVG